MKNFKLLFTLTLLFASSMIFSQVKLTGKIVDENNMALPGANVVVKGTTKGTTSDFDGKFTLECQHSSGVIEVSFVGYEVSALSFSGSKDFGTVSLVPSANTLDEVVIVGTGVIDLAKDRKTPVAVTTIKATAIQSKVGSLDVTQSLVNSPSIYVGGQSSGFGDSRISVRGFQQDNTAFLLNGQPINGMEDGKMYWSNWSGMSDIANIIQVQRGLGSSKLAISSVGGTVNFVTKTTELKKGGFISTGIGNDDYLKTSIGYNTGKMENNFGMSIMLTHWQGDGYNDGTRGQGQNYFISFGYQPNDKHRLNFLITGAPQWHDQNFSKAISTYLTYGKKYNNNWGTLNGEYLSERTNFYHKPVANLNWDFDISDVAKLSTVVYASVGRGGGTGNYGTSVKTSTGNLDFDKIYLNNQTASNGIGNFTNVPKNYLIRASMNNHFWYGFVSNLEYELSENLSFNAGFDVRRYKGDHYRQVVDFLGLEGWYETRKLFNGDHLNNLPSTITANNTVTESMSTNPWNAFFKTIDDKQKIDYDYSEKINYAGFFGQLEYSNDFFSIFTQGSLSNQSHQRFDYYDYEAEFSDSEKVSNIGYNVKAGASVKVLENHSFYANAGLYSRQPYHDNIYLNYTNRVNPLTSNEDVLGFEVGYNFKSEIFSASLNAYQTSWKNRVITTSTNLASNTTIGSTPLLAGDLVYTTNQNEEQLHKGIEFDFIANPLKQISFTGFLSIGDWQYVGNSIQKKYDENQNLLLESNVDIDGGKVGDAAQTSWGLGTRIEPLKGLAFDFDWRNYDNLYSNVVKKENLELPGYDLLDAGLSYKWIVGEKDQNTINFRINIFNVLNKEYLSELSTAIKTTDNISSTNASLGTYESNNRVYNGIADANVGYFGYGRTWSASIRFNF